MIYCKYNLMFHVLLLQVSDEKKYANMIQVVIIWSYPYTKYCEEQSWLYYIFAHWVKQNVHTFIYF